jgi:hypothetical protein
LANPEVLQKDIAKMFEIDERELRDFIKFKHNINPEITIKAQNVIDIAYRNYQVNEAKRGFREEIQLACERLAVIPRPYIELWETCPDYYPTDYTP